MSLAPPAPILPRDRAFTAGVVACPIADLRRAPDHKSELVSQVLFGETVRVRRASPDRKWLLVATAGDGYPGWLRSWSLATGSAAAVGRWRAAAGFMVTRPWLARIDEPAGALPFGARLARRSGGWAGPLGLLALKDARGAVARVPKRAASGETVVRTARRLLGVVYHWGGRSPAGLDCSGLVQLAAARQGLALPRDARQQCAAVGGPRRLRALGDGVIRPGDLWFFGPDVRTVTHVAYSTGGLGLLHAYGWVRRGSLDPLANDFEPELFRSVLGWQALPGRS